MTLGYQDDPLWDGFDILMNHARLNKPEMDKVVKKAFYLTIIRHPVDQFESAWGYFGNGNFDDVVRSYDKTLKTKEEILAKFVTDPKFYYDEAAYTKHFHNYIWNGQLFDLGLNQTLFENVDYLTGAIQRLDREFDLVMVTEYLDESLILLKTELCRRYEDIIYIPTNVRNVTKRTVLSPEIRRGVELWNKGDMLMYNHFNRTLWDRVHNYGPKFTRDLELFRELNRNVTAECADEMVEFSVTFPAISCVDLRKPEQTFNTAIREMMEHRLNITN